jgi:hypothetical protein
MRRLATVLVLVMSAGAFVQFVGAQEVVASTCAKRACELWSDGFTVLQGIPGQVVTDAEIRTLAAGLPETELAAEAYVQLRGKEVLGNGAVWVLSFFVPAGPIVWWTAKSIEGVASGSGPEDPSSALRRRFLTAMERRYPGTELASATNPARAAMLTKSSVVDAGTGIRVASMRPMWSSFSRIDSIVKGNAAAERWMLDARGAQRAHRVATTLLLPSWGLFIYGFGVGMGGGDNGTAFPAFLAGAAGMVILPIIRGGTEREARRDAGRALYLAAPPIPKP